MPAWSEPQNLKTWIGQGLSSRSAVLMLVIAAIFVSELRFSWMEVLVGRYLVVTNVHRPESGSVWEQDHLKQAATQTLEQMVTRQLTAQREAREATSLSQLMESLSTNQGTMTSAAHFKTLYSQIPEVVARTLFSPILMLRMAAEKNWERVYMERENGQVGIYLLDRGNNVLRYTTLTDQQLTATDTKPPSLAGTLDEQLEFAGRIYPADRFFMALDTLPPETQSGVLARPGILLTSDGIPVRVGISDEVNAGVIRIGFEMDTPAGRRILLAVGQEWAIWQVRTLLEPRLAKPSSSRGKWPINRGDR